MKEKELSGRDFCGFCGKLLKEHEDIFCSKCEEAMDVDGCLTPTEDVNFFSEYF